MLLTLSLPVMMPPLVLVVRLVVVGAIAAAGLALWWHLPRRTTRSRGLGGRRPRCSLHRSRRLKRFRERRVYFVSDLHLGDGTPGSDPFHAKDDEFLRFCEHVDEEGDGLVIAGDAVDLHQCPDPWRAAHAHREVIRALRRLACRIPVLLLPGNHDPELPRDLLPEVARAPRLLAEGRILVEHGDAFDDHTDGSWVTEATNRIHRLLERCTRSKIDVPLERHDNLANRLVHWGVYHGALGLGQLAAVAGRVGWDGPRRALSHVVDYWEKSANGDPNGLLEKAVRTIEQGVYQVIICGHSHQPGLVPVGTGFYANLGSWTGSDTTYGVWDGEERTMRVRDWRTRSELGPERYRAFLDPGRRTFYDWWAEHYRGWLRFEFGPEPRRRGRPSVRRAFS